VNYTLRERTVKSETIGKAISNAALIYRGALCLDAVKRRDLATPLTVEELNELVAQIVDDSKFYA